MREALIQQVNRSKHHKQKGTSNILHFNNGLEKAHNQWLEPRVIALENGSAHSQHTDETLMKKNEKQMDVQNEKRGENLFLDEAR